MKSQIVEPSENFSPSTYSTTLSTGKTVIFREMLASDLVFMEKAGLKNRTETERSMSLMERMSTPEGKITVVEIQKLRLPDFRALAELLADAGGMDDEDEDEDSDETYS